MSWTVLDGVGGPSDEARIPADDPAVTLGWSVFHTLALPGADVELHLDRLERSSRAGHVPFPPREALRREIAEVGERVRGPGARVRITLTGGGHRIVRGESIDPSRRHGPLRAVRGPHRDEPVLGGAVKHGSRLPWIVAVRESGADEVLMVDDEGRFTEGTTCGVLAVVDGVLYTAPFDGRILESTTVTDILARAERLGVPVRREGPPAEGPWDALYVASATRDLAPVVELDGTALAAWDPVGRALAGLPTAGT